MNSSDYANALDGFKDSDVMYDTRLAITKVTKQAQSLEKLLLQAFEDGWNAHISSLADVAGSSDSADPKP